MAYRMQASVPDLVDFSDEPKHVIDRYGPDVHTKEASPTELPDRRRLLERGTRFVQLMHSGWDQHGNLFSQLEIQCADTDAPSAALIQDLKDRGLLDDTLVLWGASSAALRLARAMPNNPKGRDHFGRAYAFLLCGGGAKPGHVYGSTDEFGWNITADAGARPRHAGHDHAPGGHRPHEAHLPLPGPPVPPHRRARPRRKGHPGLRKRAARADRTALRRTGNSGRVATAAESRHVVGVVPVSAPGRPRKYA